MRRVFLIAETESWAVEVLTSAARASGLEVVVATSGPDALERFLEVAPVAVSLDAMLPALSGAQVALRLRRTLAGSVTPIFLTQPLPENQPGELCRKLGVTGVLVKPFTIADVVEILAPFLGPVEEPISSIDCAEPAGAVVETRPLGAEILRRKRLVATGCLTVHEAGIAKTLSFRDGDLVAVESNSERDTWPRWLMRDPALDPVRRATAARLAEEAPFIDLDELVEMGVVAADDVDAVQERRKIWVALDLATREGGRAYWLSDTAAAADADDGAAVDGFRLAHWALKRSSDKPGFGDFLPSPRARLKRNKAAPALDLSVLEQQVISLADELCTLEETIALGRLVQVDAEGTVAMMFATNVLQAVEPDGESRQSNRLPAALRQEPAPSGDLWEVDLARLLATLWATRKSGILEVSSGSRTRSLHFVDGQILLASSNADEHRIGEILVRCGAISPEEHERALSLQQGTPGRRLGALLLAHGAVTLRALYDGLTEQIRCIVGDVLATTEGRYCFLPGNLGVKDHVNAGTTPCLILLACRDLALSQLHRHRLPRDEQLLVPNWEVFDIDAFLALGGDERRLLDQLGDGATMLEVVRGASDKEAALRTIYALSALAVLQTVSGDRTVIGDSEVLAQAVGEVAREDDGKAQDLEAAQRELQADYETVVAENQRLRRALLELHEARAKEPVG